MTQRGRLTVTHVGRYELGERIAGGGMGDVYLARLPLGGNRMVALKILHDQLAKDPQFVAMFHDEAKLLGKLAHPATVQLYEHGVDEGRHFIAMELLIGEPLIDVWNAHTSQRSKVPYPVLAWIGARVCDGLHHAHELRDENGALENVVHRDVNPSNVFVTFDGRVKVIDFGLARRKTRTATTSAGVVKGKLAYLAPEVIAGKAPDRRADVFALGTTLWEIGVDRRLFKRDADVDTVLAIHECDIPDPRTLAPDFPRRLWTIVKRALAKHPDDRYATTEAMGIDLDACAAALGPAVTATTLAQMMVRVCSWGGGKK